MINGQLGEYHNIWLVLCVINVFFPTDELLLLIQKSCAQWKPLGLLVMQQTLGPALGTRHVKKHSLQIWCYCVTFIHRSQQSEMYFLCWLQVPYKIKDVELDYDNYNQVPESPIGRDEEPHLYMVPKKYRKVRLIILHHAFHIKEWLIFISEIICKFWFLKFVWSLFSIRSQLNTQNSDSKTLTLNITTGLCSLVWSLTFPMPTVTAWSR